MADRIALQVRATEDDKERAKKLAAAYGVNVSDLIRYALLYIDKKRPDLTITYSPRGNVVALAEGN